MWDRLSLVTAPSDDPVTLDAVKAHLRVDDTADDALVSALIKAATAMIDGPRGAGIALMPQQWKLTLDGFPSRIRIPLGPVTAVDSIEYVDTGGTAQTLAADQYQVDLTSDPVRIAPAYGMAWPATRCQFAAVTVAFSCGKEPIPDDLRAAVLLILTHLYENRSAVQVGSSSTMAAELPLGVESILNRYRAGRTA